MEGMPAMLARGKRVADWDAALNSNQVGQIRGALNRCNNAVNAENAFRGQGLGMQDPTVFELRDEWYEDGVNGWWQSTPLNHLPAKEVRMQIFVQAYLRAINEAAQRQAPIYTLWQCCGSEPGSVRFLSEPQMFEAYVCPTDAQVTVVLTTPPPPPLPTNLQHAEDFVAVATRRRIDEIHNASQPQGPQIPVGANNQVAQQAPRTRTQL